MMKKILLRDIKGVGEKTEQLFGRLNLQTTEDLLHYYPRNYEVYAPAVPIGQLKENAVQTMYRYT